MDKEEIVRVLKEISVLLEIKGDNPFKIRAYQNSARALEISDIFLGEDPKIEDLKSIDGIGQRIAESIRTLAGTGNLKVYEELKKTVPPGVLEMLKIPTLGPRKIKYLFDNLDIKNIGQLEYACNENWIAGLPNFGKRSQDNILKGIEVLKKFMGKFLFAGIIEEARAVHKKIQDFRSVKRSSLAGSVRRKKEIVKDIDIVAGTDDPGKVMDFFTGLDEAGDIIAKGATKSSIRLKSGVTVDIRADEDFQYPYALHHFTGSKEHNTAMRSMAKKDNAKMNEYGLFKDGRLVKCSSEKDIFDFFSMDWIPPEIREGHGEIEAAKSRSLPALVEESDLKGILHIHTTYSDGNMSAEQACKKLIDLGFEYAGISDHGIASAQYAGGLEESQIDLQSEEIDRLNKKYPGFRIFKGIESNILLDGKLDYGDKVLSKFDFVIAAVHSNFNLDEEHMTERIIRAIENRFTTILAHPTGRLLLARDPYRVDIIRVINAASDNDVGIELNASPYRLDLDWRMCKYAKQKKVKIFINPDAHNLANLQDYRFGVNIARKGWLEKDDVANTLSAQKIDEYLKNKKAR